MANGVRVKPRLPRRRHTCINQPKGVSLASNHVVATSVRGMLWCWTAGSKSWTLHGFSRLLLQQILLINSVCLVNLCKVFLPFQKRLYFDTNRFAEQCEIEPIDVWECITAAVELKSNLIYLSCYLVCW